MKREIGYYWIKDCGEWKIALWINDVFKVTEKNCVTHILPSACEEINEQRILNPNGQ